MPKRKFELEYDTLAILRSEEWKTKHKYELSFFVGDTPTLSLLSMTDSAFQCVPNGANGRELPLQKIDQWLAQKVKISTLNSIADFDKLDENVRSMILLDFLLAIKPMFAEFTHCDTCGIANNWKSTTCDNCLCKMSTSLSTDEQCHMCCEKKKIQFLCSCLGSATCFGCVQKWLKLQKGTKRKFMQCTICRGQNDAMFILDGHCVEVKGKV